MKKIFLGLGLVLLFLTAMAQNSIGAFNKICQTNSGYFFAKNYLIFNDKPKYLREQSRLATKILLGQISFKPARLFIISNDSPQTILLNHVSNKQPGASAGWASLLSANHASAILLTNSFVMSCQQQNGQSYVIVPCQKVLAICQISHFHSDEKINASNFWVAENETLDALMDKIQKRGILFGGD